MATKTPQEKHAEKLELLRLESESAEYQTLAATVEIQTQRRKQRARKATSGDRAAANWAERLANARLVLSATSDERNAILEADALMARSVAKAAREGELDAESTHNDSLPTVAPDGPTDGDSATVSNN